MPTPLSAVHEPARDAVPTGAAGSGAGSPRRGFDVLGAAALVATVCLWSAFALSDRALASSTLRPADAALIRFGLPVVLLAPALWKRRGQYAAMRPGPAIKIILGGGVPFYLAVTYGGSLTSAAFVGALVPGMIPLFTALLGARGGQSPKRVQAVGLGLISLGAAALVAPEVAGVDERTLTGVGLLLLASGLWSLYTAGLRETNLDPVASMGLLCAPTFAGVALLAATGLLPSALAHAAPRDVLVFALVQGIGTGVCSGLLYAVAVRRLGTSRCATVGSLSPVLTAAAAMPLLGERLTVAVTAGTALIAAGVILANRTGAPRTRRRPAGRR
ncbi:DMT family transporter [Nonomuraea sp. SMC257]|uniref:DMT family transporter n=1 Tax=Nonomuraea montanisoli TaxID=2741721 RepID=A0A7Y6M4I3_9ACTN|nr:DMT family transporter [Nonomuraea montanisoli]NUW33304.1 DMT family transporter [Nonomuraea montanisoli]